MGEWIIKALTLGFAGFGVGWALIQLRRLVEAQDEVYHQRQLAAQDRAWRELRDRVRREAQTTDTWRSRDDGDAA